MKPFAACVVLAASARLAGAQPAPAPAAPTTADAAKPTAQQKLDDWDAKTSDYDKLRTPDSPAFVILGVSPTEIQRPTTPKGVSTSLGGFVSGADVTIPKNYALEVAPYWLFAHPDLDARHYREERWRRLYRTFSVSVGTAQTTRTPMDAMGMATSHTDSDLGIGGRAILWQGGGEDECTRQANASALKLADEVRLGKAELDAIEQAHPFGSPEYNEAVTQAQKAKADQAAKNLAASPSCVAAAVSARGLSVDLAGAIAAHFADSKVTRDSASLAAKALWFNASYDLDDLAIAGMVRYASHDVTTGTTTGRQRVVDGGVQGLYKAKTFALSAEGLYRYRVDAANDRSTYKVDVSVEYEVRDGTWISVTLGKNFTFAPGDAGSLFSLANVKLGMGKPKIGGS
ncbi:MAG TPA: hypothetical protein VF469_10465 [Kofleriaceae bacterium]